MRNNRGFALIELIIVAFIMALLTAGVSIGYGILTNSKCRLASKKIANALELVRIENMTKKSTYSMTITQSIDGEYDLNILCDGEIISSEKLKLKSGCIRYETSDNKTIKVNGSDKLEITFRKDTGAVKENSSKQLITGIRVEGEKNSIIIRLATATGKLFFE